MSRKFFSLIRNEDIRLSPKTKVVDATAFSTMKTAEEILQMVQEDAQKYKRAVITESEKVKEQAQREGYQAGFQQWAKYIAQLENEIQKVRKDVEKMVVPIALKAAKKIVGREIELSQDTVFDIVSTSLKAVSQHKRITIYVNKKDLEVLETHRPQLKQIFESLDSLSIREKADVKPGGCVIETEVGIINAQLENQWEALERAFQGIMRKGG